MSPSGIGFSGYTGRWAFVNLTDRSVRIDPADPAICRDYVGGRGVQARLIYEHLKLMTPLRDPLSPENRLILGIAAPNDTFIPTAGRGSCSFISPLHHKHNISSNFQLIRIRDHSHDTSVFKSS